MVHHVKFSISLVSAWLIALPALNGAWAQQIGAGFGTINADISLSDDDLDGIEDGSSTSSGQPQQQDVQFSTSLDGDETTSLEDGSLIVEADDGFTTNRRQLTTSQDADLGNPRARRTQPVGNIQDDGSISPLANRPAAPVQGGSAQSDDSPYAALGIRVGTFTLSPVLTQSIGSTSNADAASDGSASIFSQTDARLTAVSNWALHELRGEIGGTYQTFFDSDTDDLPSLDASFQLRLDHSYDLTTRIGGTYNLSTESAESDNLTVPFPLTIEDSPNVHRFGGFAEVEKQAGRYLASLRGAITHSRYEDASLSDGSNLAQDDRNNTLYELQGRVGYEISPSLQPFVEASLGARRYESEVDRNGNRRNSMLYALRAGVEFDRGDKLNGEISVGYSAEEFDDNAINNLDGLTIDANINWSPQRLTTFTAAAQSEFTGSTNADEAGSVTYAISLDAVHDLRPNLSLNARVLASLREYDDSGRQDEMLQGQIGAEWRLNRTAAVIATVGHEVLDSSEATSSYEATTARIGLRLQR